jgi:long-subunit acyl-CoA synthetase (AMP-forming)
MIPVNSVPAHVEYILNKTEPHTLIISQIEQLEDIDAFIRNMNFLKAIIILSSEQKFKGDIYSIPQVVEMSQSVDSTRIQKSAKKLKLDDLISIMFTSGTTGNPKGIMFSHQNIVFKRFARAMA